MNKANDSRNYDPVYYKGLPEVKLEVFKKPTTTGSSTETSEPSGKVTETIREEPGHLRRG
jgi:hypothetical protein